MREVARVGRFPIMREVDAQTREQAQRPWGELREVLRPGVEETEPTHTPTAAQLNARQQAEREAIHKTCPTAYERVASDFLSDADDFD